MKRDLLFLGAGYMLGALAAVLAVVLAGQSAPEVPNAKAWHLVELNGSAVPVYGWLHGERLIWSVDEQTWSAAPVDGDPGGRAMGWYFVTINQAEARVRGWVDDAGGLGWRWADQKRALATPRPAAVNPAGAMANGVDAGKLDGRTTIRASDEATAGEVRAVMQAAKPPDAAAPCKPDGGPSKPAAPDRIKPPDLVGGGLGIPGGFWLWAGVAICGGLAFGLTVVCGLLLLAFLRRKGAAA
ncbi:hypothetical protein [Paludisphaera soli]|uniref:hypothetical protein n=1 Tax=Paludisphaera soli TaxID=2712865 RepID=UPI0013EC8A7A|nr:hypothetical protein [Paludisphaera soli]